MYYPLQNLKKKKMQLVYNGKLPEINLTYLLFCSSYIKFAK